jgi:hypothetical protein
MRALRARKLEGKQSAGTGCRELPGRPAHEGVVAFREQDQEIAEIAAARVAERPDVFNARQRIAGIAANRELASRDGRAEKWTRDLRPDHLFAFLLAE